MSKKLLLLFGIFIVISIVFILSLIMVSKTNQEPDGTKNVPAGSASHSPTSSISQPDPNVSVRPTFRPVEFTGDSGEVPEDIPDYVNARFDLQSLAPIETEDFLLSYDYDQGYFVVTLSSDTNSKARFEEWLESNNFNIIPDDQFQFN